MTRRENAENQAVERPRGKEEERKKKREVEEQLQ